ncbi:MAG: phosphoribosylamine--glycine ligase [Sulfolobales archaeon]
MKVVVVGEGAREHAIALMISRSSREPKIFSLSSYVNLGLKRVSERSGGRLVLCNTVSPEKVAEKVGEISPDLIIVGPEEPQFHGVVDSLIDLGYAVFGATKKLSQIEKSKVFMRELMWTYKIPGRLTYKAFTNVDEALEYVSNVGDVVIKPARQAGGKGVKVIADVQAYLRDIRSEVRKGYVRRLSDDIMSHYTDIDYKVLIEERVEGVEYTVMTITDGYYVLPLPLVQDHPHAFEFDIGPETGGMGSIQGPGKLLPFINEDEFRKSVEIVEKSLKALQDVTKERYVGALSGQMMLTSLYGPTLIEFYSRFGDPEIANLIPTLDTDFLDIIEAAVSRKLASVKLRVSDDTVTVVKAVCPRGYPNNRKAAKGHPVVVDEFKIRGYGCEVLYSGVELVGNTIYTTGSRIAEVLCEGRDFQEVSDRANKCAEAIKCSDGWEVFYRSDIGSNELLRRRISLAELVRNAYSYRVSKNILNIRVDWIPGKGVIYYE